MKEITVYLCGGIDGLSNEDAVNWRRDAKEQLHVVGIKVIDPTVTEKDLTTEEIVVYDLQYVKESDIILVGMHLKHAYIGTSIEIRKAWEWKKPIVVWGTENRCSHFLQYHATTFCDELKEAVNVVRGIAIAINLPAEA